MTLEQRVEWLERRDAAHVARAEALGALIAELKNETKVMLEAFWRAHRAVASQAASALRRNIGGK